MMLITFLLSLIYGATQCNWRYGRRNGRAVPAAKRLCTAASNWRHSHWEVDVIAHKTMYCTLLKLKPAHQNLVTGRKCQQKKIQNLVNASEEYLYQNRNEKRIQFDILSITILKTSRQNIFNWRCVFVNFMYRALLFTGFQPLALLNWRKQVALFNINT